MASEKDCKKQIMSEVFNDRTLLRFKVNRQL
jgi:hypothetical protein